VCASGEKEKITIGCGDLCVCVCGRVVVGGDGGSGLVCGPYKNFVHGSKKIIVKKFTGEKQPP